MPKIKFTVRGLDALPAAGRIEYWDEDTPGFGLRVLATGERVFFVRYRVGRRSRRVTLGSMPPVTLAKARKRAKEILSERMLTGKDPLPAQPAAGRQDTLAQLVEEFVGDRELADSTAAEYRRMANAYLGAAGKRSAAELDRNDLKELLERVAEEHGGPQANRLFQLLRATFNWAAQEGLIVRAAIPFMKRPRKEASRERVLRPVEIRALWLALEDPETKVTARLRPYAAGLVKALLLLGTRLTETMLMRWQDLELGLPQAAWTIPGQFRKGERLVVVPLAGSVVKLLEALQPAAAGAPRVFGPLGRSNIERNWWKAIRTRAGEIAAAAGDTLEDFTLHDLRRTCATGCAELGAQPHIVSAILGHKAMEGTIAVSGTYNRYQFLPEKAAALNAWAAHVRQIASGKKTGGKKTGADVLPFGRG